MGWRAITGSFVGKFVGKGESPGSLAIQVIEKIGAGDGTRTHDVQLGKLAFYH